MKDQLKQAVIDGQGEVVVALTQALLATGTSAREILDGALLPAMAVVGERMRSGDCFIPEVLLSARTMQSALDVLRPYMAEGESASFGTIVIGTVEGDLHDIGKNLVGMMLKGANFEIVDLGTNVSPEAFAEAAVEHHADVVGISALLTTTMVGMKAAVEAVRAVDPKAKILVGGAPVTDEFADEIGADGFAKDAATAAVVAQELLN